MNAEFGGLLRSLREAAGISMGDLARHLKVTTPYISNIELGRKPPLTQSLIIKTALFLEIDAERLLVAAAKVKRELTLKTDGLPDKDIALAAGLARRWNEMSDDEKERLNQFLNSMDEK